MHNWNFKIQKLVEFQYPLLHSPHLSQTSVIVQQQQQLSRKNRIQKIQKKYKKSLYVSKQEDISHGICM